MDFLGFFTSSLAIDTVSKLLIALILSAIIGLERELVHKPAGIKTHTLICLSATLVMSLGMYMRNLYPEIVLDPTRLPAQILAGIGFVGAGTIIREGFSVKGITTAASLLSITCVGLAVGAGFYEGAIIGTLLIFIILYFTSPIQNAISNKSKLTTFTLISRNEYGIIGKAQELFEKNKLEVIAIKQIKSNSSNSVIVKFSVKCNDVTNKESLIQELTKIEGITEVNLSRGLARVDVDVD